jgi:hypothetical protein
MKRCFRDTESVLESWQKHIDAWNDNPLAFVIGGMVVEIKKVNTKFLIVSNNKMGLRSLGLHLLNDSDPLPTDHLWHAYSNRLSLN